MPNWCYQNLTVRGDKEEIKRFCDAIRLDDRLSLNHLYPTPQELIDTDAGHFTAEPNPNWKNLLANKEITQEWYDELVQRNAEGYAKNQENIAKYGYGDWYDWNCAKWGTKWGACEVSITDVGDEFCNIKYESAWSPASGLIAKISSLFPKLMFSITFTEESDAFAGVEVFVNGEIIGEYVMEPELDELPDYEADEDAYYEAYHNQQQRIMSLIDDKEDELIADARELLSNQ